jgi:hypothetical protein
MRATEGEDLFRVVKKILNVLITDALNIDVLKQHFYVMHLGF